MGQDLQRPLQRLPALPQQCQPVLANCMIDGHVFIGNLLCRLPCRRCTLRRLQRQNLLADALQCPA
jgi:hypothetical protein